MFGLKKVKKTKSKQLNIGEYKSVHEYTEILLVNDHIDIVSDACAECYQVNTKEKSYEEREEYIKRRIATGHESILEHSNIVMLIHLNDNKMEKLLEVLPYFKYLNYRIKYTDDSIYLLVGGSIRGYKHIFRNIDDLNNPILKFIKDGLYLSTNSCYFTDFIEEGILLDKFLNEPNKINPIKGNNMDLINVDDINIMINKLKELKIYEENPNVHDNYLFNMNDLMDMCTVTIHWTKVSRIISQQLTRHRAAITQKSQRYVNYSDTEFLSPDKFKPEKYDSDKEYTVSLKVPNKDSIEITGTLNEIGTGMLSIYTDLFEQGLFKEDARAYLPNNVETSLYMTYTLRQFIFVTHLRTEPAAQAEIRILFNEARELFNEVNSYSYNELLEFIEPRYNQSFKDNDNELEEEI